MERLRQLRRERGLTQQELGDKAGVSQDAMTKIELGRREPRPSTLRKLAGALDVGVEDLFRATERKHCPLCGASSDHWQRVPSEAGIE